MNYNATRNVNQAGGIRKAKRVSDVAAMGTPMPTPTFNPGQAYPPGFVPATPPPPYQEGIQLDNSQSYNAPAGDFNFMGGFPQGAMGSPAQIGAMIQQPIVQDMAMQYGGRLAQQSKEVVQREISKYVPVARLRYYFAVDTKYVLRKLLLILFPFRHKEWMVKYEQDIPVQPRYDLNAPDLYIPFMGYVTYVLLAGFILGLQQRFSPEQIGMQASSALAYIIFEMMMYLVTLYVTGTSTNLRTLDLLAFSGYKYTAMIGSLLGGLMLSKTGYYSMLVYSSFTLSYFLVKTLRVQLLSGAHPSEQQSPYAYNTGYSSPNPYTTADNWQKPSSAGGTKRRLYFLLFVAIVQPLLSWWLTYHLIPSPVVAAPAL